MWASEAFHIRIPHLVNVSIALSIALVKSVLVALFFMQLKYDNPLNGIVFLFCLFAFALFLFFSMADLGTRAVVYAFKSGAIQPGGLGINTEVRDENNILLRGMNTGPDGIVAWARKRRIEKIGELASMGLLDLGGMPPEQRYEEEYAIFHHGQGPEHSAAVSDANHTVPPKAGPTPGLYAPAKVEAVHGH